MDHPKEKRGQRTHTNIQPIKSFKNMKTSLKIIIGMMAFMSVWTACQLDIPNMIIAAVSFVISVFAYVVTVNIIENEGA